jgi:biopolymer transport protein ExbD
MAGGMDLGTHQRGGKKPLDAAINLVPFIDLMAVTISFLIMTAVWTQLSRLQVSQAGGPAPEPSAEEPRLAVTLRIDEQGYTLTAQGVSQEIPRSGGSYDVQHLEEKLQRLRTDFPEQRTITVQSEDSVKYADLVRAIDACVGVGLDAVSVSAAG